MNYENGDAIGINTNATKIATAYNGKYGGSFEELSDAQKQNYILEYVNDIYELNGVMGQSERESKSFENVFGNLKSSISTFAAKVMEPFMDPLINAMQRASEWMSTADEKFFAFVETIKNSTAFQTLTEVIQLAVDKVQEFGQSEAWSTITTMFEDLGQAILDIDFVKLVEDIGKFLEEWAPLIGAIMGGITALKLIFGVINTVKNVIGLAKVAFSLFSGALAFLATPIGIAVLAIGILIGIGIALWQNWDTIKVKLQELKDKFIADWEELKTIVGTAMTTLKDAALADFEELKTGITTAVTTLKDAAIEDFNELKTIGSEAMETLKTAAIADATELKTSAVNSIGTLRSSAVEDFNELKTIGSNAIKTLKTAGISDFNALKTGATNAASTLSSAAVSDFLELKNGAIRAWNSLKTRTIEIFNNVKDTITGAFDNIDLFSAGKAIIDGFGKGLRSAYDGVKSFVGGIAGWIEKNKGPISYDRKLLIGAGNAIMEGLDKGLKTSFKDVQSTVSSMGGQLQNSFNGSSFDISSNARSLNGSVNQSVNHVVSDNLTSGKQPLNATFNLGNKSYRAFVDDISNTQNAQIQLTETYL